MTHAKPSTRLARMVCVLLSAGLLSAAAPAASEGGVGHRTHPHRLNLPTATTAPYARHLGVRNAPALADPYTRLISVATEWR